MNMRYFFLTFAFLLISCQQVVSRKESCHVAIPDKIQTVSISGNNYTFRLWKGGSRTVNDATYLLGITDRKADNDAINRISGNFNLDLSPLKIAPGDIATLVLFVRRNESMINKRNLLGISLYHIRDRRLGLDIFAGNGDQLSATPLLHANDIGHIPVTDFYKMSLLFKKSPGDSICALVLETGNFSAADWKKIRKEGRDKDFERKLDACLSKADHE